MTLRPFHHSTAPLSRRSFQQFAIGSLIAAGSSHRWAAAASGDDVAKDAPAASEPARVVSQLPARYHGWPTVAKSPSGELWLVCSGGREQHVCPFGRVELMRSKDGGKTWTWPQTVLDGPIDDRDAGVLVTSKGTILITTFTSLAYVPLLKGIKDSARRQRWEAAHHRLTEKQRQELLGVWMMRSDDHGKSFSAPYRSIVNSPHGPIELRDGRLLYAGRKLWEDKPQIGVCESRDDGRSWQWLAPIPTRDGDNPKDYHELHAVEAADGTLIAQIRNHNAANRGETLQSHSADGGKTWSQPRSIGVWGLPSHLLRLADDRIVMSYGHRRRPYGNQARISEDNGQTWSAPIAISTDGVGGDLGYPSTVQLDETQLLTVWYEKLKASSRAVLRQRRWVLPS